MAAMDNNFKQSFRWFLNTFRVKREELFPSIVLLILMYALNFIAVKRYFHLFSQLYDKYQFLNVIWRFKVSGFDPFTYQVITEWSNAYVIHRHPLLAIFVYPLYLLNQLLSWLTGMNLVQVVVMAILLFLSYYTFIFIYRILREIIGLCRFDSTLLSFFLFSFGYVMLTFMVPDHFAPSMFMLVLCLYVCGKCIQKGRRLLIWQTILIFLFTAGTTLSNGIKVFIDALFVNGKRFFRWRFLLFAVIVPSLILWGIACFEDYLKDTPSMAEIHRANVIQDHRDTQAMLAHFKDTTTITDSALMMRVFKYQRQMQRYRQYKLNHPPEIEGNKGKPIAEGQFIGWTDITTPRLKSTIENIFGEPIQIHHKYLLQDANRTRPAIVEYGHWQFYVVEAFIVLLLLIGILCGCRSRFLWMALSGVAFDAFIHVVLGFALNEVYIMTGHWIFIIPIALAFLFKRLSSLKTPLVLMRSAVMLLAAYLFVYNIMLINEYFSTI